MATVKEYRKVLNDAGFEAGYCSTICSVIAAAMDEGMVLTDGSILHYAMDYMHSANLSPSVMYRHFMGYKEWTETGMVPKSMPRGQRRSPHTRPATCSKPCKWARDNGCACKLDEEITDFPSSQKQAANCRYFESDVDCMQKRKESSSSGWDRMYRHYTAYQDSHSAIWA